MIGLFAVKPLVVVLLGVSAVGLTAAGQFLQRPAPEPPVMITKIVPTVIRVPGHTTIIQVPGPRGTRAAPAGTITVPGGGVTVTPAPQPGPTVTVSPSPSPAPSQTCVHPPGQKCRFQPHPSSTGRP